MLGKTNSVSPYPNNGSTQANIDAPLTQVYQTRDYDKFRNIHGNRILNLAHVKRLTDSMAQKQLVTPIIVNENFEITDGAHRFTVCKELSLPVYYIVVKGYGLKEVQMLNSNNTVWNKRDYLESYCQLGLRNYIEFKRFAALFPDFQLTVCGMLLSDKAQINSSTSTKKGVFPAREFESGKFVITDFAKAQKMGNRIKDFQPYYKGFCKPAFVRALMVAFKNKNYSHDIMMKKLKAPGNQRIQDQPSVTAYLLLLEDIFNYKNRNKVSLRYSSK